MAELPPQILVNGDAVDHIPVLDRGLAYGDGVFRTLAIVAGRPRWWSEHLAKLQADARRLGIAAPGVETWEADLARLGRLPDNGVIRLTLTRGMGPRGYRPPAELPCTRILACWEGGSAIYPEQGLNVRVCQLRLAVQPALAGVKHLNRLENVLARGEWSDPDIHEGLLRDQEDRVVGGVMSNVFLWADGRLLTPRLDRCGVAGMTRQRVLERAGQAGLAAGEADFGLDALLAADAVLLCNSLMGVRPIHRLGSRTWPATDLGARLAALIDA